MRRLLCLVALLVGLVPMARTSAIAQISCDDVRAARAFHGLGTVKFPPFMQMGPDANTKVIVEQLLKLRNLNSDWVVLSFNDGGPLVNAWAVRCASNNYIITNSSFLGEMQKLVAQGATTYTKDEIYWGLIGIVAHEVGHHLRNHAARRPRSTQERHQFELEADYEMGFMMAELKASYLDAVQSIRDLGEQATETHPPASLRRAQIGRGWEDASGQLAPVVSRSPLPMPAPAPRAALARYDVRHSRDIEGFDLVTTNGVAGIPGLTHEDCAKRCSEDQRCTAYSHDKWHARCFLKDAEAKAITSYLDPTSVIGIKIPGHLPRLNTTAPRQTQIYRNKVFRDEPLASPVTVLDFDACSQSCAAEKRCVVFSYRKTSSRCLMFSKAEGFYFDQSSDSGAIRQVR